MYLLSESILLAWHILQYIAFHHSGIAKNPFLRLLFYNHCIFIESRSIQVRRKIGSSSCPVFCQKKEQHRIHSRLLRTCPIEFQDGASLGSLFQYHHIETAFPLHQFKALSIILLPCTSVEALAPSPGNFLTAIGRLLLSHLELSLLQTHSPGQFPQPLHKGHVHQIHIHLGGLCQPHSSLSEFLLYQGSKVGFTIPGVVN